VAGAPPAAMVFGCAATRLTAEERAFFRDADPFGFILFARNCEAAEQIRGLVAALRDAVGRADAPVLIDQEGGRVARLKPPLAYAIPPARRFGELFARDADAGRAAAWLAGWLIGRDLAALGIDVDCAPVLDLARPETTQAIGDRAFAADPRAVAGLGRAVAEGLRAGGVLPVIKHMPGHGRARVDSHAELPTVEAPAEELERSDFVPFRMLADMPLGMTAHVRYVALDPAAPATHSATVIGGAIRRSIGFDGLLFSDDLAMQALSGPPGARAARALAAGCDIALHCTGQPGEMHVVAAHVPAMTPDACRRWHAARAGTLRCGTPPSPETAALLSAVDGDGRLVDAVRAGRPAAVDDRLAAMLAVSR
jgi:beta-N-acetylhexosaminidase